MTSNLLTPATTPTTIHEFETAGLGKAPYKFLGIQQTTYQACYGAPIQPGACCMFCATGIIYQFWLRSADGKTFFVGSDCIMKSGDAGLKRIIEPHVKKHEKEMREAWENEYITEFDKFVKADPDGYWNRPEFKNAAHPNRYYASQGKTLGDYQLYCYTYAGHSAKARMAHKILIAEGLMKKYDRCAKRITEEVMNGIIPEGAIIVRKTLFSIIPESDDPTIFVVSEFWKQEGR